MNQRPEQDVAEMNPYASPLAKRGVIVDPPKASVDGGLSRRKLRTLLAANAVITCCAVVMFVGGYMLGGETFARLLGPCYWPLTIFAILSVPTFFGGLGHILFLCIRGLTGEPRLLIWAGYNLPFVLANGVLLYLLDIHTS